MAADGLSEGSLTDIIRALELIHNPTSTNDLRRQALGFLESQKLAESAAQNGYALASGADNPPLVRYFGLSLLDHVLCHISFTVARDEIAGLKMMILELAGSIRHQDPSYLRNKVSQLWAELAKRSWGLEWLDMDESLVKLWNASLLHKEFVLTILETLSEDIFYREDTVSSLRGTELNRALVEIFTPLSVLEEAFPERDRRVELRFENEGWLIRTCSFLEACLENLYTSKDYALKSLVVLKSVLIWSIPKAIVSCHCVAIICRTLTFENDQVLLAAIEALHALYSRSNYDIEDFQLLVHVMYQADHLTLMRKVYERSIVGARDIDETRYAVSKKLSELMSYLAAFLEEKGSGIQSTYGLDIPLFLEFLIVIFRHQSLTVSIPILHSWSRLLASERLGDLETIANLVGPLLEICTQRLVRWESLPENADDPTVIFLNEDIDTIPERHAFVGNYRRYCSSVIEIIVQRRPHDAISHILSGVDLALNNLCHGMQPFSVGTFKKSSIPLMRADMQFSVVEATLRGYARWVVALGRMPQKEERQCGDLETSIEAWALSLMQRDFKDPIIKQRVIKLIVDISSKALDKKPSFALKVLEHILMMHIDDYPECHAYSEAVKELHSLAGHELRRLAIRYADYFATFYDLLEPKIREIAASHHTDDKLQTELTSILLIILQRSSNIDPYLRELRVQAFIEPIKHSWQNEDFKRICSSFRGFCELLGFGGIGPYMQAKNAHRIEDWSTIILDEEGKRIQETMTAKFQLLPLRGTKTMLAVSTEKVKKLEPAYVLACSLWRDHIPFILPTLLQLVSHAHAFHNPENWGDISGDMKAVVGRILTDRFWQAGISSGSREEFYARITSSRSTLEGFASSVRGKIRAVRETCYSMLFSMSRLREHFYGFEELPGPLSEALFHNSMHLSSHQFSVLLNISRCLIDDCPVRFRGQFLPPMLATLFHHIDKKVTTEWDDIERRKTGLVDGDLTEEMKDESILRQLTYSTVVMVASLLDPQRGGLLSPIVSFGSLVLPNYGLLDPDGVEANDPSAPQPQPAVSDSMRHFVLSSPLILEPLIIFCTHALRMRDTRCCSIITRVIRSILQDFAPPLNTPTAVTIREFISSDVLRACITSVNEPYFVDMQKDFALLIASIWILYGSGTETPRSVMLSLPGMTERRIRNTEVALMRSTLARQQRALVLDLLEGLRGVSISEQGKITLTAGERRKARSAMQERYMTDEMEGQQKTKVVINDGPDLDGLADMFS